MTIYKEDIYVILFALLIAGWLIFTVGGLVAIGESHEMCENSCLLQGTEYYSMEENHKVFSTEDLCICHTENGNTKHINGRK